MYGLIIRSLEGQMPPLVIAEVVDLRNVPKHVSSAALAKANVQDIGSVVGLMAMQDQAQATIRPEGRMVVQIHDLDSKWARAHFDELAATWPQARC